VLSTAGAGAAFHCFPLGAAVQLLLVLVQVMYAQKQERQAMKDALEMAVLTCVSQPNIIQVYTCYTDMVEDMSGLEDEVR
jgi:hypothetical protein